MNYLIIYQAKRSENDSKSQKAQIACTMSWQGISGLGTQDNSWLQPSSPPEGKSKHLTALLWILSCFA